MPISIEYLFRIKSSPSTEEAFDWIAANGGDFSAYDIFRKLRFSIFIRETQGNYGLSQGRKCLNDFVLYEASRRQTKILMSFAMAGGGMQFVQWLRNRLMRHYNLFSTDSVYVDCVTARSGDCYYGIGPVAAYPTYAEVRPDRRPAMAFADGAMPIGAMHPLWNWRFLSAMRETKVMLFVLTAEFLASVWCMQELQQFGDMLNNRQDLRGVVLNLYNLDWDPALVGLPAERVTVLTELKETGLGGMLWDQGLWGISSDAFDNLVGTIGPHPEWRES